jgi:hypothetical protein
MGKELEFFESRNATVEADQVVDGVACKVMKLEMADTIVTLWVDKAASRPYQVAMRTPKVEYAVRYDVYRRDGTLDMSLFAKPADVEIEASK